MAKKDEKTLSETLVVLRGKMVAAMNKKASATRVKVNAKKKLDKAMEDLKYANQNIALSEANFENLCLKNSLDMEAEIKKADLDLSRIKTCIGR